MEFIWSKRIKMPVYMPMGKFTWTGVYGLQIGKTFIGIVRGFKDDNTNRKRGMMSRDLIDAAMECNFYNEIGSLDDEVIKDIADNYNVDFEELKNKWEEIYYE